MKSRERGRSLFSALKEFFTAGKKAREDAERNRKRLREAAEASREFGAWRLGDAEIKKAVAALVYEADLYITAALESGDALYEPLVLDALDTARAAVNAWKKNEDDAAAGRHLRIGGAPGGIVIPESPGPRPEQSVPGGEVRERTLAVLRESIRLFSFKNSIRRAGDTDAALAALDDIPPQNALKETKDQ